MLLKEENKVKNKQNAEKFQGRDTPPWVFKDYPK